MKELLDLRRVLDRHSWKAHLASQRSHEGYEGTDLSYRLLLRDSGRVEDLAAAVAVYEHWKGSDPAGLTPR